MSKTRNDLKSSTFAVEGVDLTTAGVKLPLAELELANTEVFTMYLFSENTNYDFSDVTAIEIKGGSNDYVDLAKVTNRSFTLTAKKKTSEPQNITIQVKKGPSASVDLELSLTVKEKAETVAAIFNKSVVDICPGAEVSFSFTGDNGSAAVIDSVIDEDSPLKIDTIRKVLSIDVEGDYINGVVVSFEGRTKKIYVQATSKDIVKVDPDNVVMHMGETVKLGIELSGTDFTPTSNNQSICTIEKRTKTISPVAVGNTSISIVGTRGSLSQTVTVPVKVRETIQPTEPKILTKDLEVKGGDKLVILTKLADGDTLEARVEAGPEQGSVEVQLNKIIYTSFIPDDDQTVQILLNTTSSDEVKSGDFPVDVLVKGIPTTSLEIPSDITIKEKDEVILPIVTDARTVTMIPSVPAVLGVNSSKKSITGLSVGTSTLTIRATAINCKPVEKTMNVVVGPADLNKPILKNKLLQVEEGKEIVLDFLLDKNATLDIKEVTGAGELQPDPMKPGTVTWTAPTPIEADKVQYTFIAKAVRQDYNLSSKDYTFNILVTKKKEEDKPDTETGMSMSDVLDVIRDTRLTFNEKITLLSKDSNYKTKMLLQVLTSYETLMVGSEETIGEITGGGKNFELFTAIKSVTEIKDNNEFQALFSLINLVFKEYAESAYQEVKMHRFEDGWPAGTQTLIAYKGLVTCICMLCDINTRTSNLKRVDFDAVFNSEDGIFKEYAVQSVRKFYTY